MTDGATRLMEVLLGNSPSFNVCCPRHCRRILISFHVNEIAQKPESKVLFNELNEAYHHLTSRDPKQFWTSGQVLPLPTL
jgi:hypothetical protein